MTSERPLGAGEALRRVFECIASGILLEGTPRTRIITGISICCDKNATFLCKDGPGIKDPCEKESVDATEYLSSQQRENITQSAQVRLLWLILH